MGGSTLWKLLPRESLSQRSEKSLDAQPSQPCHNCSGKTPQKIRDRDHPSALPSARAGLVPQHSRDDLIGIQPRARSFSVLTNSRTPASGALHGSPALPALAAEIPAESRGSEPRAAPPGKHSRVFNPGNYTAKRKKAVKSREILPQHPATARQSPENPRASSGIFSKRCSQLLSPGDDSLLPEPRAQP